MSDYIKTLSGRIISADDLVIGDILVVIQPNSLSIGGDGLYPLDRCRVIKVESETVILNVIRTDATDVIFGERTVIKKDLPRSIMFYDADAMNSKFTDLQVKVYTQNIEVGDAVWQGGVWWKVESDRNYKGFRFLTVWNRYSNYPLSLTAYERDYYTAPPAVKGYRYDEQNNIYPYRVTTLKNYKVNGDEKFVWLGQDDRLRKFGEVREGLKVIKERNFLGSYILKRDIDGNLFECYNGWGVIPKYSKTLK